MSDISYVQSDCAVKRYKNLSILYYKRHMGEGTAETAPTSTLDKEWKYLPPGTLGALKLERGCNYVK
jgi:hypothetical protein